MLVLPCGGQLMPGNFADQPAAAPTLPQLLEPVELRPPLPAWTAPALPNDFSLADIPTLAWLATLARSTYAPNGDFFTQAAQAVLGTTGAVTFTANDTLTVPGTGMIAAAGVVIVVISGTTNLGQWMEQIFNTALVNTNFGAGAQQDNARCGSVYRVAALGVEARLPAAAATLPLLLVGHSMGGAVAEVLAYKRRLAGRRGDKVLTFASPKPGDQQLARQLPSSPQYLRRLTNPGDFVPTVPPDLGIVQAAVPAPLQQASTTWGQYRHPGQMYVVNDQGGLEQQDEQFFPLALAAALVAVAAANPLTPATPHLMSTFWTRLRRGFEDWNLPGLRTWNAPAQLDQINAALAAVGV